MKCETDRLAVLIEVKIHAGAKSHGQLRAYSDAFRNDHPEWVLNILYLAPTVGLGESEVGSVRLEESEFGACMDWATAKTLAADLPDIDTGDRAFIDSGFERILNIIEDRKQTKFPLVGESIETHSAIGAQREGRAMRVILTETINRNGQAVAKGTALETNRIECERLIRQGKATRETPAAKAVAAIADELQPPAAPTPKRKTRRRAAKPKPMR